MAGGSSAERLAECMPFIFQEEGGLSMDRADHGNWDSGKVGVGTLKGTKYGIAAHSHPNLDIKNLTKEQATVIYANEYWGPSGCPTLPAGVDLVVMDHSVNAGVSRGKAYATQTGNLDPVTRVKTISAKRASWYRGIKNFSRYGKVWLGRVARSEAHGLKMALKASGATPTMTKDVLVKEAAKADAQVKKGQTGAVAAGTGAGGIAAGGANNAEVLAQNPTSWGLVIVGVGLCVILVLLAVHFIRAKHERKQALLDLAATVQP